MPTETSQTAEAEIRQLLDDRAAAISRKDLPGLLEHYAPDLAAFDAWGPLQIDRAAQRDHWEQCFAGHEGEIGYEHRDVVVTASDDVAFVHCLVGMSGTLQGGTRHSFWGRGTLGLRKIDGRWRITHEHASAPFDPHTGQACPNLTP